MLKQNEANYQLEHVEKERYHIVETKKDKKVEKKQEVVVGSDGEVDPTMNAHKECEDIAQVEKTIMIKIHEDDSVATVKFANLNPKVEEEIEKMTDAELACKEK